MKKDEIQIGETYIAKVTGARTAVRIDAANPKGGWDATNVKTNRKVRIKSAQRLQRKAELKTAKATPTPAPTPTGVDQSNLKVPLKAVMPSAAATQKKPAKEQAVTTSNQHGKNEAKANRPEKQDGMSCLDAAAKVLSEASKPMTTRAMVEAMADKGYWTSDAATPWATLYSAILREIKKRGESSRFVKSERGKFACRRFDGQTLKTINATQEGA